MSISQRIKHALTHRNKLYFHEKTNDFLPPQVLIAMGFSERYFKSKQLASFTYQPLKIPHFKYTYLSFNLKKF